MRLNAAYSLSVHTDFLFQAIRTSLADAESLKYALALTYNQAVDEGSC